MYLTTGTLISKAKYVLGMPINAYLTDASTPYIDNTKVPEGVTKFKEGSQPSITMYRLTEYIALMPARRHTFEGTGLGKGQPWDTRSKKCKISKKFTLPEKKGFS